MRKKRMVFCFFLAGVLAASAALSGCSARQDSSGKIEIELLQYKPEAVDIFEQLEDAFNATHDDIHLTISSPSDATTIMKTRFMREDYPDLIGIGGDMNFSYFVDSGILADVSDYPGLADIKDSYVTMLDDLEFAPTDGIYGVPYVANAAGILYNRDLFKEHGWEIPTTWEELIELCDDIRADGILPFYFGFKDTWTCLAPWNALAVDLAPSDTCAQVNQGNTTFTKEYREIAEKMLQLLQYGEDGYVAYDYNSACTAFANGESAMYTIGSYAVPQIKSANPDINIDSFVMPGSDDPDGNTLNSGVDLQFCVTEACPNKEAAYEVLDFLLDDENIQTYIDDQAALPCKDGDFDLPETVDGMLPYIEADNMTDYQDHHYPSEMAVDAQIQTLLLNQDVDAFLEKFDTDWVRYNRDIVQIIENYNRQQGNE